MITKDLGFCTVVDSILVIQVVYKSVAPVIHEFNAESENMQFEIKQHHCGRFTFLEVAKAQKQFAMVN